MRVLSEPRSRPSLRSWLTVAITGSIVLFALFVGVTALAILLWDAL